jgi:proteasome lid subunit RPN8/RPN11
MKLATVARDEIIARARQDAPFEVCGYLAEKDGVVSRAANPQLHLRNHLHAACNSASL